MFKFQKAFRERSFSGRNAELGKMMDCPACGFRHRAALSQCHKRGEVAYAIIAEDKHARGTANPYWRAKPGKMFWIPELKKFMTITR